MQSGKIKHWNEDKGYGFIEVDKQHEDVFFHISNVRLSQPLIIGQQVYFTSERNDKNQLRALEVTEAALGLQEDLKTDSRQRATDFDNPLSKQKNLHDNQNNRYTKSDKKSPLSTLFSLIAIIVVAIYFFTDVKSSFFTDDLTAISPSQNASVLANDTNITTVTGDVQIDNTIALIKQGGPYPYPNKDGSTFYNRENRLPAKPKGYYREYTVPTPNVSHRGARRIVTGGKPPEVYYLTLDHYDSFSPLEVR